MLYKDNWEETKQRFNAWWSHSKIGRPMMSIRAVRNEPIDILEELGPLTSPEQLYLEPDRLVKSMRNYCKTHNFMAESYPNLNINLGPGSLALYLGSEPKFAYDTVWYKESIEDLENFGPLKYDKNNYWWKLHLDIIKKAKELSKGEFHMSIPDLLENVDILAAMRGPQPFCYDLMDNYDLIKDYIQQLDNLYFKYYDKIYDIVKNEDGSSSYTAFDIWSPGKTGKIQCDFSALMSPSHFRELVQPSIRKQCQKLNSSLYHLDGKDAIKHLDAIMEIEELDALQWVAGAGQPDGGNEKWYPIYEKVKNAGKSLWISIYDGDYYTWTEKAEKLVNKFGSDGLFLFFPEMTENDALTLIKKAEKDWNK